jgi:YggT family protein
MLSQLAVVIGTIIDIYSFIIVVWCFMSFIPNLDRRHPAYTAVQTITAPILDPMRRMLPTIGTIDVSPILAIFLLRIIKELVYALLR